MWCKGGVKLGGFFLGRRGKSTPHPYRKSYPYKSGSAADKANLKETLVVDERLQKAYCKMNKAKFVKDGIQVSVVCIQNLPPEFWLLNPGSWC